MTYPHTYSNGYVLASNQSNANCIAIAIEKMHHSVYIGFLKCLKEKPPKCEINRQVDRVKLFLEQFSLFKTLCMCT